jgi:biopolymer transport protein ExbD
MCSSKLIIRLIDIVFILLFGFIAVSQIDTSMAIDPPKSSEAGEGRPGGKNLIIVGVTKDGTFPIDSGDLILLDEDELRRFLAEKQAAAGQEGKELGIRIRANWDSPVEYSLTVAQICRNLGLPKGLDVIKLN